MKMPTIYALIGALAYLVFFCILGAAIAGCGGSVKSEHEDRCATDIRKYYEQDKGCSFAGGGLGCLDKTETVTHCSGNLSCPGKADNADFKHVCYFAP